MATSKVENSAKGSSCLLKFVHGKTLTNYYFHWGLFILVRRVPGLGPEQRESTKTVLYLQLVMISGLENYSAEAWCHCVKVGSMVVKRELYSLP